MTDDTYSVELTFREWMDVCHALGHTASNYRDNGMDGQANKYNAITDKIAEGVKND